MSEQPKQQPAYHLWSLPELESNLETSLSEGLKDSQIKELQEKYGPNELTAGGGISVLSILAGQVFNAMMLVLILAFCVSLGIRSWIESGVIAAVILINIVVGFLQEYGSAKTMSSLKSLSSPTAHVVRSGNAITIPSREVVVGDLVELKTGDVVPADLRMVEVFNLEADEALLTGESVPVAKDADITWSKEEAEEIGVGDRINMAYTSSTVTKGRGRGIAIAIAMDTQIGGIAQSLGGSDTKVRRVRRNEDGKAPFQRYVSAWALTAWDQAGAFLGLNVGTPLQRTLSKLAVILFFVAVLFAIIVFSANSWKTDKEISLYAVATGLSMIPASLVVVLTITLAGGTRQMAARNVIVRKLDSLEALGAVTDICSDKTGTLTQGKMVVRAAYLPGRGTLKVAENNEPTNPTMTSLTFAPFSQSTSQTSGPNEKQPSMSPDEFKKSGGAETLLNIASLCNLATVVKTEEGWKARGDPTECAIQVFAHRFAWGRDSLTSESGSWTQLAEYPFDSDSKRMSVIFARNSEKRQYVFSKGAVERMIPLCSKIATPEGDVDLDSAQEATIHENVEILAEQGLRVLTLATRSWTGGEDTPERADVEKDLTFIGLVGLYDPPRPETQGAVRECHNAGVNVHMLTGDHAATARAIAIQVGILPRNMAHFSKEVASIMVMTAAQFDKYSDDELDALPILPLVVARCAPNTKVRMVEALHRRKAFVAMTGDGVNDAPSLKRADIGIAMGLAGSDVAKDASDLVLTDDRFSSITGAVEEGRRISDNICKFVLHLLAQNVIQALVLLIGLAFKDVNGFSVFPLAPVEILWVIMITSGLPAMGIGSLSAASDIMERKPRKSQDGIFTVELIVDMFVYGMVGAALCLATFTLIVFGFNDGNLGIDSNNTMGQGSDNVFRARSATFSLLTWISLFLAFEVIDLRRSFFRRVPGTSYPLTQWARDIWDCPLLFWSCLFGFLSVFPIVYIPGLNTVVMKHAPISWEWALVFIGALIFFAAAEAYKLAKRVYFRRQAKETSTEDDGGIFKEWRTLSFSQTKSMAV